jgi:hypothetical protein
LLATHPPAWSTHVARIGQIRLSRPHLLLAVILATSEAFVFTATDFTQQHFGAASLMSWTKHFQHDLLETLLADKETGGLNDELLPNIKCGIFVHLKE